MADATRAARSHLSHTNSQGRNTQTKATTGKNRMLQNIAHLRLSSVPPLSNIIGDITAVIAPRQVNAMFTSVNRSSTTFIWRSLLASKAPMEGKWTAGNAFDHAFDRLWLQGSTRCGRGLHSSPVRTVAESQRGRKTDPASRDTYVYEGLPIRQERRPEQQRPARS